MEPRIQYAQTSDGVALKGFDEPVRLFEVSWEA